MIAAATAQLAEWHRASARLAKLCMHVNSCGRDLAQPGFASYVRHVLRANALAARRLALEMTESSAASMS
jgi:EAL domain-containing protein (putative c-di-GMP-specific phosphodiesterase class I)